MTTRRIILGLFAAIFLLPRPSASAAETTVYSPAAFEAAQKGGQSILMHITASWCTTCAVQKPILAKISVEPRFKALQVFEVDFDSHKDVVRQLGATMQSMLITFKGGKETGRSVADTKPAGIAALLDKAI